MSSYGDAQARAHQLAQAAGRTPRTPPRTPARTDARRPVWADDEGYYTDPEPVDHGSRWPEATHPARTSPRLTAQAKNLYAHIEALCDATRSTRNLDRQPTLTRLAQSTGMTYPELRRAIFLLQTRGYLALRYRNQPAGTVARIDHYALRGPTA